MEYWNINKYITIGKLFEFAASLEQSGLSSKIRSEVKMLLTKLMVISQKQEFVRNCVLRTYERKYNKLLLLY